jgi:hypothetical protein
MLSTAGEKTAKSISLFMRRSGLLRAEEIGCLDTNALT